MGRRSVRRPSRLTRNDHGEHGARAAGGAAGSVRRRRAGPGARTAIPRDVADQPGEPSLLAEGAPPGEPRHAADHHRRDDPARDPDREREDRDGEQRPEREHRGHRERGAHRAGARVRGVDQEVVRDQDEPGEDRQPRVRCGAAIEPDRLGPQQHLGRRNGEPEGRVHHRQRDLGEHPNLAGDAQRAPRLVGEIAMTPTAKTCSIIHVGLWKRWRTRQTRLSRSRGAGPSIDCPRGAPRHRSPATTPRTDRCPRPRRIDAGGRGGCARSSRASAGASPSRRRRPRAGGPARRTATWIHSSFWTWYWRLSWWPLVDVDELAAVAIGDRPAQLVAPGLVDPARAGGADRIRTRRRPWSFARSDGDAAR